MKQSNFEANIWPPRLQHLHFNGRVMGDSSDINIDPDVNFYRSFRWPDGLTRLTIEEYDPVEPEKIYLMLRNPRLSESLRSLSIFSGLDSRRYEAPWVAGILPSLPRLRFLCLTAFMLEELAFNGISAVPPYDSGHAADPAGASLANSSSCSNLGSYSLEVIEIWPCSFRTNRQYCGLGAMCKKIQSYIDWARCDNNLPLFANLRAIGIHHNAPNPEGSEDECILELDHLLEELEQLRQEKQWLRPERHSTAATTLKNVQDRKLGARLNGLLSPPSPSLSTKSDSRRNDDPSKNQEESSADSSEEAGSLMQAWTECRTVSGGEDPLEIIDWAYRKPHNAEDTGTDDEGYVGVYFIGGYENSAKRFGKGNLVW